MTSSANDLTERLRRRLETERQAIEELTASELERLGANSRRVASNALRIIEADTAVATGRMRALLLKAWLRPLVVGLSRWLGICGGSWATMHWLSTRIQARIQTAAALDPRDQRGAPDPGTARGDHLGDRAPGDRGGAVRGAAGRRARLSALDRGQSAGREAVERVKELYDRLRTAVDEGLEGVVRAVRAGAAAARPRRSRPCGGRSKPWSGRSRS